MAPPGKKSPWTALAELSSIGIAMVLATVIGFAGGYYADKWLGTEPWLLLIGLGFGIAAGFVMFFRSVSKAGREIDDSK
jgi:ATP synthase protein I